MRDANLPARWHCLADRKNCRQFFVAYASGLCKLRHKTDAYATSREFSLLHFNNDPPTMARVPSFMREADMSGEFQVTGDNAAALFTLKLHRGDGMALLAMNWKNGKPPRGLRRLRHRVQGARRRQVLRPEEPAGVPAARRRRQSEPRCRRWLSPIQKFRWVHFPRNAELPGEFIYRVTPVFMNDGRRAELRRAAGGGDRAAARDLSRASSTSPSRAASCRRRRSSIDTDRQDRSPTLLPGEGRRRAEFHARRTRRPSEALDVDGLRGARRDPRGARPGDRRHRQPKVRVVAYDLNEPEIVSRLREARRSR